MRIISDFKIKDPKYIHRLAKVGDVVLCRHTKYIRTLTGYISELGREYSTSAIFDKRMAVFKGEQGDLLEDLLIEAEKRIKYGEP